MDIGWTEGIFVLSVLIILVVVAKLNKAIKLLNNRVNIQSAALKQLKKMTAAQEEIADGEDVDEALQEILNRNFR